MAWRMTVQPRFVPGRRAGGRHPHFNMKIVGKHIIKGAVRVYVAKQYYCLTLSRDMSKYVQKKTRTCGICTTSSER